jgi:hypothetical protein
VFSLRPKLQNNATLVNTLGGCLVSAQWEGRLLEADSAGTPSWIIALSVCASLLVVISVGAFIVRRRRLQLKTEEAVHFTVLQ